MTALADAVTLQISLAPTDLPHAAHIVPHQLRQLGGQVDEVLFVVDLHRSNGRFAEGWYERLPGLRALIDQLCCSYPHARSVDVDYRPEARAAVERTYFDGRSIPVKDYRGGPFYAYFYGLLAASSEFVFHVDSDMLFGGGSATWVARALEILESRPDVLACNPLPGPPTADGTLRSQKLHSEIQDFPAYRSGALSTRLFLLDRRRVKSLSVASPKARQAWTARLEGNPPFLTPEGLISSAMETAGLLRLDFLGPEPGMWSLHPPYRSRLFYDRLPSIIEQIERGDVPDGQRGCHDIEDCMVDWSDVRPSRRRRMKTHCGDVIMRVSTAVSPGLRALSGGTRPSR
jgi:hypothetical protein